MSAENSKSEAEQNARDNPALPVQKSTSAKTPPTGEEQNNSPILRTLKDPQWWQAFAAAVLVPVGAYALWIYGGQLDEMRKSTKAATKAANLAKRSVEQVERNSRLDQRAWVSVREIKGFPKANEPLRITAFITNTGRTPARHLKIIIGGLKFDPGEEFDFSKALKEGITK